MQSKYCRFPMRCGKTFTVDGMGNVVNLRCRWYNNCRAIIIHDYKNYTMRDQLAGEYPRSAMSLWYNDIIL